ncbi:threonine ammonia-lyase [Spelaeicoccus albus]|uniref:L-threonine dehydratase catabolic TdcB n=1 Tax=Spelaeicoccus albus TaxID=1280376 RepID=A0A7Z0D338_9MICO|nr:threonine ammonia-lyase [Spelaeicoccus albus]NYI67991.1 threonine dehydratase [Spelaeicoccus albus]
MVDLSDIRDAAARLQGTIAATPLERSRALSGGPVGSVYLKCENLQRTGSFKIRGALNRISRLSDSERGAGVVAASAGNHAQGVALASALEGTAATIFMPEGAALPKIAATESYGAEVKIAGSNVDEAMAAAKDFADTTSAMLIPPFDNHDIVAGQGTVGLEILDQLPTTSTIVVSLGGGGLLAGIACAVKSLAAEHGRTIRVVGVQAEAAAAWPASLETGRPVALAGMDTMADGIAVGRPGDIPFELIRRLVDDVVTVSEEALSSALLLLHERAKLTVEPAGAAAAAAVMERPRDVAGSNGSAGGDTVAVVSGGNIDPLLMLRLLRHGLSAAGRYLHLTVRIPDHPGALAGLLEVLAAHDTNILEISHVRTGRRLGAHEVSVDLQVETRGADHCRTVIAAIGAAGYAVHVEEGDREV